jgi:hypothetical protein
MITHGREQLKVLAARCALEEIDQSNGWVVDVWRMNADDVNAAIDVYRAVLMGVADDPVVSFLAKAGIDLPRLLLDEERGRA